MKNNFVAGKNLYPAGIQPERDVRLSVDIFRNAFYNKIIVR